MLATMLVWFGIVLVTFGGGVTFTALITALLTRQFDRHLDRILHLSWIVILFGVVTTVLGFYVVG